MRFRRWLNRYRLRLVLATTLVALSALGTGLFLRTHISLLHGAFEGRSLAYVQAFASAVKPWIERDDLEMLRSATRLLLAGSPIYAQVADDTGLLVDERAPDAQGLELPFAPTPVGSTLVHATGPGGSHLDISAPLPSGGYVRVGVDRAPAIAQATATAGIAAGSVAAFDMLPVLSLFLVLRERRGRSAAHTELDRTPPRPLLTAGPLRGRPNAEARSPARPSRPSDAEAVRAPRASCRRAGTRLLGARDPRGGVARFAPRRLEGHQAVRVPHPQTSLSDRRRGAGADRDGAGLRLPAGR